MIKNHDKTSHYFALCLIFVAGYEEIYALEKQNAPLIQFFYIPQQKVLKKEQEVLQEVCKKFKVKKSTKSSPKVKKSARSFARSF